jgi:hypothetical protein
VTGDLGGIGAKVEEAADTFNRLRQSLVAACFKVNNEPRPGIVVPDC